METLMKLIQQSFKVNLPLQLQIANPNPEVALISQLQTVNLEVDLTITLFPPLLHNET